jgi:cell division protein FtsL
LTKKKDYFNSVNSLIIVFTVLFLALIIWMPKIYLQNNIYYISKNINKLYSQYISLKEENKFLEQQLEKMKYKNQIMDSLILQNIQNRSNKK